MKTFKNSSKTLTSYPSLSSTPHPLIILAPPSPPFPATQHKYVPPIGSDLGLKCLLVSDPLSEISISHEL